MKPYNIVTMDEEMLADEQRIRELMFPDGRAPSRRMVVKAALRLLWRVLERADKQAIERLFATPTGQKMARGRYQRRRTPKVEETGTET